MRPDTRDQSEKIAAELRAPIMAGYLKPSAQLDSVLKLASERGVSTTAIQNVLKMLKSEGNLESQTGKDAYVRDRRSFVVDATAYLNPAERGVTYKLLRVAELAPTSDVADTLGENRARTFNTCRGFSARWSNRFPQMHNRPRGETAGEI
ncbi:GntR family transcriptional regulator [Nonomuraea sp. NPDC004702]